VPHAREHAPTDDAGAAMPASWTSAPLAHAPAGEPHAWTHNGERECPELEPSGRSDCPVSRPGGRASRTLYRQWQGQCAVADS
jgi:hypothetical protein